MGSLNGDLDVAPAESDAGEGHLASVHFQEFGLEELVLRPTLRRNGVSSKHVEELMSTEGHWPPILVAHRSHVIIDGVHRFEAARRLGMTKIVCECTTASPDEAYVEFIRRNVAHGLPLSLSEREAGARRILRLYPPRSDRWVGELCGLSHGTVARLRTSRSLIGPIGEFGQLDERIGRDGKARPVDRHKTRQRIVEYMDSNPEASLRSIASLAGASPETVRKVRGEIGRGDETKQGIRRTQVSKSDEAPTVRVSVAQPSCLHAPLQTGVGPLSFAEWFAQTSVSSNSLGRVSEVPVAQSSEISQEAHVRAAFWFDFAKQLEDRGSLYSA